MTNACTIITIELTVGYILSDLVEIILAQTYLSYVISIWVISSWLISTTISIHTIQNPKWTFPTPNHSSYISLKFPLSYKLFFKHSLSPVFLISSLPPPPNSPFLYFLPFTLLHSNPSLIKSCYLFFIIVPEKALGYLHSADYSDWDFSFDIKQTIDNQPITSDC